MNEVIARLRDKDDKSACKYAGQIEDVFDEMSALLYDDKPTVVRQCLGALHEVALFRPEMTDRIFQAVEKIDLGKYKDSMSPLIERDINELKKVLRF